jgi:hypothetical protein
VYAESHVLSEYQIKAGFLYNFAKFIEWPAQAFPDAHAPITIGILGQDPFGDILDQAIKGQVINGRKLAIRRLKGIGDLKACHILFISSSEKKHLTHILEGLKASSVLTVGEIDGFTQRGGIIKFTVAESQVRLEINVDLAQQAGLKISAKLLALAKIVRNEHHEGKE